MAIKDVYKDLKEDEERDYWISTGLKALNDIHDRKAAKKYQTFINQKDILNENIRYKTAVGNAELITEEHAKAYGHENGAIDYYVNKYTPLIQQELDLKYGTTTREGGEVVPGTSSWDPRYYQNFIREEALTRARDQKTLLDNAYKAAMALQYNKVTYDDYVKLNDGIADSLGANVGARIRGAFKGESKESLEKKAKDAIIKGAPAENATAMNLAFKLYNQGLSFNNALKVATSEIQTRQSLQFISEEVLDPQELNDQIYHFARTKYRDKKGHEKFVMRGLDQRSQDMLDSRYTVKPITTQFETDMGNVIERQGLVTMDGNNAGIGNVVWLDGQTDMGVLSGPSPSFARYQVNFHSPANKAKGGMQAAANNHLQEAIEFTSIEMDHPSDHILGLVSKAGLSGKLDVFQTAQLAKNMEEAQDFIGALGMQINKEFLKGRDSNLASQLAAQAYMNNVKYRTKDSDTWYGFKDVGDLEYDSTLSPLGLDRISGLHVLEAFGSRENTPYCIHLTQTDMDNIFNRKNMLEEFKNMTKEHQEYFLTQFEDEDKYYFMHQSYDGNGNETPYELLEEIFEGEGGLISNILGHLIRPEIGIL